jgi:hypothetical protein
MNDDQFFVELEKDRIGKFPHERAPKTAPNRLKDFRSPRDGRVSGFKIVRKTKSKAGFFVFIPAKGIIGFPYGFRLDCDVSHDVSKSAPWPAATESRAAGSFEKGGGGAPTL